jgi:hypothetical protein
MKTFLVDQKVLKIPRDPLTSPQGKGQFMTMNPWKMAENRQRSPRGFTLPQKVWRNITPASKQGGSRWRSS